VHSAHYGTLSRCASSVATNTHAALWYSHLRAGGPEPLLCVDSGRLRAAARGGRGDTPAARTGHAVGIRRALAHIGIRKISRALALGGGDARCGHDALHVRLIEVACRLHDRWIVRGRLGR
jgi:hypothetical protein